MSTLATPPTNPVAFPAAPPIAPLAPRDVAPGGLRHAATTVRRLIASRIGEAAHLGAAHRQTPVPYRAPARTVAPLGDVSPRIERDDPPAIATARPHSRPHTRSRMRRQAAVVAPTRHVPVTATREITQEHLPTLSALPPASRSPHEWPPRIALPAPEPHGTVRVPARPAPAAPPRRVTRALPLYIGESATATPPRDSTAPPASRRVVVGFAPAPAPAPPMPAVVPPERVVPPAPRTGVTGGEASDSQGAMPPPRPVWARVYPHHDARSGAETPEWRPPAPAAPRWPSLPEARAEGDSGLAALQVWERSRRLDTEQRGD